jgi:hypothetical protein
VHPERLRQRRGDEKGGRRNPPPPPPLRPTAEEWLPPLEFLPPETPAPEPSGWVPWTPSQGMPPRPRHSYDGPRPGSWDPQRTLDDLTAAQAAGRVYDSMDNSAAAIHARLATLTDMPAYRTWERGNPAFKPLPSGFLWTAQGPRRVAVLLDTVRRTVLSALAWLLRSVSGPQVSQAPCRFRRRPQGRRWGSQRRCGSTSCYNAPRGRAAPAHRRAARRHTGFVLLHQARSRL